MLKWTKQQAQKQQQQEFISLSSPSKYRRNSKASSRYRKRRRKTTIITTTTTTTTTTRTIKTIAFPSNAIQTNGKFYSLLENVDERKMPAMTSRLERYLQRRSLDTVLDEATGLSRRRSQHNRILRHSLTASTNANKENLGVQSMRHSLVHGGAGGQTIALQDLSNGPSQSVHNTPTAGSSIMTAKRHIITNMGNEQEATTPKYDKTPFGSRLKLRNLFSAKEESLSSTKMGDVTLDRMLDAIIESARKEISASDELQLFSSFQRTPTKAVKSAVNDNQERVELMNQDTVNMDESIHEMEVRTPQHLRRQRRVVRRRNNGDKRLKYTLRKKDESKSDFVTPRETLKEMIGLTLPNGIPSPETPVDSLKSISGQVLTHSDCNLRHHCSTPTIITEPPTIKRCLSFSCNSDEEGLDRDTIVGQSSSIKRCSVASSIASSTTEHFGSQLFNPTPAKGSLDLSIYADHGILNVHGEFQILVKHSHISICFYFPSAFNFISLFLFGILLFSFSKR